MTVTMPIDNKFYLIVWSSAWNSNSTYFVRNAIAQELCVHLSSSIVKQLALVKMKANLRMTLYNANLYNLHYSDFFYLQL